MTLLYEIILLFFRIAIPIFIDQFDTDVYVGEYDENTELRIRKKLREEGWIR